MVQSWKQFTTQQQTEHYTTVNFNIHVVRLYEAVSFDVAYELTYCHINIILLCSIDVAETNFAVVKEHIKQQGSVDMLSLKSYLIGPSCVGKTTLCSYQKDGKVKG